MEKQILDPVTVWIFSSVLTFIYSFVVIHFLYKNHKFDKIYENTHYNGIKHGSVGEFRNYIKELSKFTLIDYLRVFICALIISIIPFFNYIIAAGVTCFLLLIIIGCSIWIILDYEGAIKELKSMWDDLYY